MESNTKTARPYAIAAFKQAQEEGESARWSQMMSLLTTVTDDSTMKGLITNPKVKRDELAEIIIDVCGDRLTETGRNFVRVLAENRRLNVMHDIVSAFDEACARVEKRSDVTVTSAHALSPAEQNDINVAMTKRLATKVDLSLKVDPALIGGVIIRSGDMVIDASIRGRLNQLTQTLA